MKETKMDESTREILFFAQTAIMGLMFAFWVQALVKMIRVIWKGE